MKPTECEITLDLCGLEPPEPMERVLAALRTLDRNRYLCMLIDREPHPLYPILFRNGFLYSTHPIAGGRYEVCIWWQKP